VATANIDNDAVTFAKIQNIATDSLLGRDTAGSGDPENLTLAYALAMSGAGALGISLQAALFQDQRAQNTNGGTATADTWTARTINTTVFNNITGASLAGNTLTLATAGLYVYFSNSIFVNVTNSRHRFQNTSDATTVAISPNSSPDGLTAPIPNLAFGVTSIASSKNFQLQYYVDTINSATDLGEPMNTPGENEVYSSWLVLRFA